MLKASLAAGAGLALGGWGVPGRTAGGDRVVIIGAGFAGLACADELRRAGIDAVALECRRGVGGRVLSLAEWVEGAVVEGGAELIGANHPNWLRLARRFNLELVPLSEHEGLEFPILLRGERLSKEQAESLYEGMDQIAARLTELAIDVDADEPWTSPAADELDNRSLDDWARAQECDDLARHAFLTEMSLDAGVPASRQSLLGVLAMVKGGGLGDYWTASEAFRCRGGNQRLARALSEALGGDGVRTNFRVARVRWREGDVEVESDRGERVSGTRLVLAAPPSVWHRIRFDPPLPGDLTPQMGVAVKYLARVRTRFWLKAGLAPEALTDGPLGMTWEGTDGQTEARSAVLTVFGGAHAADSARSWPAQQRDERFAAHLEPLFPGYGAAFAESRFMDWPGNPDAGAGYAFPAPGEVTSVSPRIAAGLGAIDFAGEWASPAFVGYMEGALSAGVRVARRIAARTL
jgi:monoamine oxidase